MAKTQKATTTEFDSYELSILEDAIALYVQKTLDEVAPLHANDPDRSGGEEMSERAKALRARLRTLAANDEEGR